MTQLPFEDLPPGPIEVICEFDEFWKLYPRKVSKCKAITAYNKAVTLASHDEIMDGLRRYIANKPGYADWAHAPTWLNGDRWEDEYDTPHKVAGAFQGQSLETIAEIVRKAGTTWARCRYPRDVLEQCVRENLLTVEQMEAAL